jgi:hypothetical protein
LVRDLTRDIWAVYLRCPRDAVSTEILQGLKTLGYDTEENDGAGEIPLRCIQKTELS